jgi:translation initiation factor 1 (eIF-1/SUI1)
MRRAFNCNGTVLNDAVITLQGDQRENVSRWLVDNEVLTKGEAKERLVVHGF